MPIGGKDAFLSKVTFRRESNWYSKTKQELKDMTTIEERAKEYRDKRCLRIERLASLENLSNDVRRSMLFHCYEDYKTGATEQKAIDNDEYIELEKNYREALQTVAVLNRMSKELIDKACEWLSKQDCDWWEGYGLPYCIEEFRKAMEE